MRKFSLTKLTIICALMLSAAGTASANEMVNNRASGYIGADGRMPGVTQVDEGGFYGPAGGYSAGNGFNIEVGSITANSAISNDVEGRVRGNVSQVAVGHENTLDLKLGSVKAEKAIENNAFGYVSGSIEQVADGRNINVVSHIGAIDASENGFAMNNRAEGIVDGHVMQYSSGSNMNLRVGSITQPNQKFRGNVAP